MTPKLTQGEKFFVLHVENKDRGASRLHPGQLTPGETLVRVYGWTEGLRMDCYMMDGMMEGQMMD